ncbi:hypothetical protein [Caulobacter segnis]|uniref:hypothetical protein n=1 Tax=Caulobacter segnis TaxID=88688 RepID=UPI00285C7148|nr:hypothetical protein [Caulobacter segnis]MDR6625380.1 hypothetical protein [Caulobacter segnis]
MKVLIAGVAAAMLATATAAYAGVQAKVESIDPATVRISVPPEKGLKLDKMRAIFLRAASQEALDRGYEWFQIIEVVDNSRQRTVERPGMNSAVSSAGGGYTPLRSGLMLTAGPEKVQVVDSGVIAVVTFGRGQRPENANVADAREMLAKLR